MIEQRSGGIGRERYARARALFGAGSKRRHDRISGWKTATAAGRHVEGLEERRLFATFVVTSGGDVPILFPLTGMTLRQAIVAANTNPGADTIAFNIAGAPVIEPLTPLPAVTGPTLIDGTTQPGYAGTPVVYLDGTATIPDPLTGVKDGLVFAGGASTLRALAVSGFDTAGSAGVRLAGGGSHRVENSYVGPDPTGEPGAAAGNNDGVVVESDNNVLAGNLISGNSDAGVRLRATADGTRIAGNRVGTDATGTAPYGNGDGVVVEGATHTLIGGTAPAYRNVISGNFGDGIRFLGSGTGNVVAGNTIGLSAGGDRRLANTGNGVSVEPVGAPETTDLLIGGTAAGARNVISGNDGNGVAISDVSGVRVVGNYVGTNAAGDAAVLPGGEELGNFGSGVLFTGDAGALTVGGATVAARNVISGNFGDGVLLAATGGGAVVQGNYVGTDAAGTAALENAGNGVSALGGAAQIGGGTAAAGNVISGNRRAGVALGTGHRVEFNRIGTTADGSAALGNGDDGIYIDGSDNAIGTTTTGNTIAYNGDTGVTVAASPFNVRNSIRGNNIYLNGDLGIDLGDDGVTMNDPQDPDAGPNEFQNFPVLTAVTLSGDTATISGTLNSTPNSTFAIDLFTSQIWDTSTYGEGQKYLGSVTVTTDASGNATFTATLSGVPSGWRYFAATATDADGNTSEFSYDPTP